ncbi:hypothetical protein K7G98_00610 [Saccharothrix sp. MB29]|nr:hypothetical protein [Saccharothrix sp. MB29]
MTHRLTAAQRAIWSMQEDDPASPLWNLGGYLRSRPAGPRTGSPARSTAP